VESGELAYGDLEDADGQRLTGAAVPVGRVSAAVRDVLVSVRLAVDEPLRVERRRMRPPARVLVGADDVKGP
jgi:hypothetical protein